MKNGQTKTLKMAAPNGQEIATRFGMQFLRIMHEQQKTLLRAGTTEEKLMLGEQTTQTVRRLGTGPKLSRV